MNWTKDVPTVPGFYAWRLCGIDSFTLCFVYAGDDGKLWRDGKFPATNGEWCRLVPADEVEKAWNEAITPVPYDDGSYIEYRALKWGDSRAKRVMEGRE